MGPFLIKLLQPLTYEMNNTESVSVNLVIGAYHRDAIYCNVVKERQFLKSDFRKYKEQATLVHAKNFQNHNNGLH